MRPMTGLLQKVANRGVFAIALVVVPVLPFGSGIGSGSVALALEDDPPARYASKKTKRVQAMSPAFSRVFQRIADAADAGKWDIMKARLDLILEKIDRYSRYEQAMTWNYVGYYYYEVEDFPAATRAYQKVIDLQDYLTDAFVARTLYSIAQLHYVQEDYRKTIATMYEWMEISDIVSPGNKVLLGQAYYQIKEYDKALRWVEEAIADYETEGKIPEENWWGIQKVIYYDKKNLRKVTEILETLVVHYPKAKYWQQLGGMYGELGRDLDRLVAYDLLYLQNFLKKDTRLRGLAYMYMGAKVPYKAAQIVEWGMKEGYIDESVNDLKMLAEALYAAQEVKRSIPLMERAARMSEDGVLMERLAGMYLSDDQYQEAAEAAIEARSKGKLKRPGGNYMNEGMALSGLKRYKEAEKAFRKALEYERTKRAAQDWIDWVLSEKKRENEIRKSRELYAS